MSNEIKDNTPDPSPSTPTAPSPTAPAAPPEVPVTAIRSSGEATADLASAGRTDNSTNSVPTIVEVAIDDLKTHPMNTAVYGPEPVDDELAASISEFSVTTPLRATQEHVVVDGHRRLKAARAAGLTTVPVIFLGDDHDPLTIEVLLLESNRHRRKNNEQLVREFKAYKRIETEHAKNRMLGGIPVLKSTPGDGSGVVGKTRDIAAKKVGMAWEKAERGEEVVQVIDQLAAENDPCAGMLRDTLNNKSIGQAYKEAIDRGFIPNPAKERARKTAAKRQSREAAAGNKQEEEKTNEGQPGGVSATDEAADADRSSPHPFSVPPTTQTDAVPGSGDAGTVPTIYRDRQLPKEENSPLPQAGDDQVAAPAVVRPVDGATTPRPAVRPGGEGGSSKPLFSLMDGTMVAADEWTDGWIDAKWIIGKICDLERQCMSTTPAAVARCVRSQRLLIDLAAALNRQKDGDPNAEYLEDVEDALVGIKNLVRTHPNYPRRRS